ncbi:CLUMA_CG019724, isoform A [Clunio marinus]|uniref:CLUMA_CG019724, isoform A n=1 Tax=Clunio marinus TaxID=568069 RepID=A0A1J1J2Q8_9DIPT|nr:CLUMA_CG019724, isoform A [Clunio marinus]
MVFFSIIQMKPLLTEPKNYFNFSFAIIDFFELLSDFMVGFREPAELMIKRQNSHKTLFFPLFAFLYPDSYLVGRSSQTLA